MKEKHKRSLAKGITWRFVASLDTFLLALLFTGDLKVSTSIAGIEIITKIIIYYIHERAWQKVSWGR